MFRIVYTVRAESPERISLGINELIKDLTENYGGEYSKVGLSVVWSHNDTMIKTIIESVGMPPTLPLGLYEFKVVVEGLKSDEVVRISKTVIAVLKKYELLITLSG